MEIFKIIWTALTTENEMLTNIILFPEVFLESFINMLLFTTLLNITADKNIKFKYVIVLSVIANFTTIFIPNPYCSYLNLIIIMICIHVFFKTHIIKSILACIIPLFITVLCESIIMKICISILGFDVQTIVFIPLYRLIINLCIEILVFVIYIIIKYFRIHISILENMSRKNKLILVINFIVAILAMTIQFIITGFYMKNLPWYIVIFSNISLFKYK